MAKYLHYYTDADEFGTDYYDGRAYVEPWVSYTNDTTTEPAFEHVDYNMKVDLEASGNGSYKHINLETANPCFGLYGEQVDSSGEISYSASGACVTYASAPETLVVKVTETIFDGERVFFCMMAKRGEEGNVRYESATPSGENIRLVWNYDENNISNDFHIWIGMPV